MKKHIFILLIGITILGCREELELKLKNESPRLVIEGILTDHPGPHTIKITGTSNFYNQNELPAISSAEVSILDSEGFAEVLEETEAGTYQTKDLVVKTGNSYTLTVKYNNETYTASGALQTPPTFDSLTYEFVEETPLKDEGYYIYFYGKTPKPEINYYRWLVYKNDTLYNTEPEDYLLASDEFVQESLDDLEFPFAFNAKDTVIIEMYSLDKAMYTYYNELLSILFNDGGLFSPPPVNPVSNIENITNPENKPLGYFQVSSLVSQEIIIKDQ